MKRWLLMLVLVLAAMPLMAQADPNERVQKIVTLKYADAQAVVNVIASIFQVDMRADQRMKIIAVSGNRTRVTAAEEAIKQLDVPSSAQKDIELAVYFVVGSDSGAAPGGAVPQDLQSTVATLKTTFPYKVYYLLDALSLRVRSGVGADTSGQLSGGRYTAFKVGSASVDGDGSMVRLDRLHAGLRIPLTSDGKVSFVDTGISTEIVTVKAGQKLVVGRSSLDGPSTALFLVLIASIAN